MLCFPHKQKSFRKVDDSTAEHGEGAENVGMHPIPVSSHDDKNALKSEYLVIASLQYTHTFVCVCAIQFIFVV